MNHSRDYPQLALAVKYYVSGYVSGLLTEGRELVGDVDGHVPVEGLVPVKDYSPTGRPPEEVVVMEKARDYRADAVFFAAGTHGRPQQPQAFIFADSGPVDDEEFARLHQKLWSWGGVQPTFLLQCTMHRWENDDSVVA
ncbi:MAG: hypothetical protein PHY45_08685 [Rhodocyclaceae bacterium]|nr:hypothetical protein [Rhodocyclaceae bacterium]